MQWTVSCATITAVRRPDRAKHWFIKSTRLATINLNFFDFIKEWQHVRDNKSRDLPDPRLGVSWTATTDTSAGECQNRLIEMNLECH